MINTLRVQEVFNADLYKDKKIVVVGAGAIGSHTIGNLVSVGLENLTIIDFDHIEAHNLGNQMYLLEDIGEPKVIAAKRWCYAKCGEDTAEKMRFINGKVDKHSGAWFDGADIVISCVDSFDARRLIMEMTRGAWSDLFVESSMATQHVNVFMVNPDDAADVQRWKDTLGDDDDPSYEVSACGEGMSVGPTAQMAGCVIAWQVMNYLKTGFIEKQIRVDTTPFMVGRHSIR